LTGRIFLTDDIALPVDTILRENLIQMFIAYGCEYGSTNILAD
jgi:hypothetical protein